MCGDSLRAINRCFARHNYFLEGRQLKIDKDAIDKYLGLKTDWLFEKELREKGWISYDQLLEGEFNDFRDWMLERGFIDAEYVDDQSLRIDRVWVRLNQPNVQAIKELGKIVTEVELSRQKYHEGLERAARECSRILRSPHS